MMHKAHCGGCSGYLQSTDEISRKSASEECPGISMNESTTIVKVAAEKAAATAAEGARRETQLKQEDVAYQALIGFCTTLAQSGKYLGDGHDLARKIARILVGKEKIG